MVISGDGPAGNEKKLRILIVDTLVQMRKFVKFGLEKNYPNILVEEAVDAREAMSILEKKGYDLVICNLDAYTPKGEHILSWLREHAFLGGTPVIIITADNSRDSVAKAVRLGVNAYIIKPFTIDRLVQKIILVVERFDRRSSERISSTNIVRLKHKHHAAHGLLIDISLDGMLGVFSREHIIPHILEMVVADLQVDDARIITMAGFVIRIQAMEAYLDTENIKVAVKFIEGSKQTKDELFSFIEALKTR